MNIYLHPDALQIQVNERYQRLIQEGQEAAASQRRLIQQVGNVMHWLGKQFVVWGQQIQARSAPQDEKGVYHGYPTA